MKRTLLILILALLATTAALAEVERGVTIIPSAIYIAPDAASAKLTDVDRGRELVVLEHSRNWLHVTANVTQERTVTGWMPDKGVVRKDTPNGDQIMFGEASASEGEASRRYGRKGAAQDAMRLYRLTEEYFPKSPLAGQALYRAADIRWQLQKQDVMSRPSAKEMEPFMRQGMDEEWMKDVIKKFPDTKWADMARFELIDNKLCGDWKGESKCPEKESDIYEKYAKEHPKSPDAPIALYNAAWRQAALIEIYKTENKDNKSSDAKSKAISLAQQVMSQYPDDVDWKTRAERLIYLLQEGVPTYGAGSAQ